jgi:hypothetical protein
METIYFVLGMLSIIGVTIVAAIVWGVVKIAKLLKANRQLEEWLINNDRSFWENANRMRDEFERKHEALEQGTYHQITDLQREMHAKINDQITDSVTQCNSYTDKRIDKLIDAYFDAVGAKKQTLKG